MNLNFIGNTIDEIFGVKKKKDPIIKQQTLPSGLVVAKAPSQPTLTVKPAVSVKSPLTVGTPASANIKIKTPTFTDNYSQPVSTASRAKTLYQGIRQNQNIDDLSNRTGLGKQEILDFAKENGLNYGDKSILETAGEIAKGFVVDPFVNVAKDIAVKPAVTLARSLDPNAKKATQDALVAMDTAYKSGAISQAKLKEKFDDLMSDEISNGYKVTENGIEKMNPLGQTGQFAGQFVQAGSDVSNFLPFGIGKEQVKKLVMKPGEMAAKEILKTQAKQSAIIGTANTASDLLNDRGVSPESLAMNYAVPFVFGTVADTVHLRNKNAQFAKKSINIIDKSYQATIKNGGVTIDLDGVSPTTGYVFSPDKTTELVVDKGNRKFNKKVISDFMTKNAGALMEKGNHLGIWEDDGKIYLDVSTVGDRTPETIAKAQLAQQKGVFDLDNFETIDTGNIDENGVYSPLDEAVNIHNKYQEQIAGRIGEAGDVGPTELPTSVQEAPQGKNKVSFKVGQPASTPQVTKTEKKYEVFRGSGDDKQIKTANGISVFGNNKKYYAFDEPTARQFGSNIEKTTVNMNNPLELTTDSQWKQLATNAGVDPYPTGNMSNQAFREWGNKLTSQIEKQGHDGVVVKMDKTNTDYTMLKNIFKDDQVIPFTKESAPQGKNKVSFKLDDIDEFGPDNQQDTIARHFQLFGPDNTLGITDLGEHNGFKIYGQYINDLITLSKGGVNRHVLNHESVHKAFDMFLGPEQRQKILSAIRLQFGDEALIKKYEDLGYKGIDIDTAAEEELADGFIKYASERASGKSVKVLGRELNIPANVIALYERALEKIKGFLGETDYVKQLYSQLESGKFKNAEKVGVSTGKGRNFVARPVDEEGKLRVDMNGNKVRGENFWVGKDKQTRVEFDDSKMELIPNGLRRLESDEPTTLGDVIKHDELFKQFPHLSYTSISYNYGLRPGNARTRVKVGRGKDTGFNTYELEFSPRSPYTNDIRRSDLPELIMHEVQHIIQEEEGLAKGGNLTLPTEIKLNTLNKLLDRTIKQIERHSDDFAETGWDNNTNMPKMRTPEEWDKYKKKRVALEKKAERIRKQIVKNQTSVNTGMGDYDGYFKIAGEVESRNVSRRLKWTPEQRNKVKFKDTFDVPEKDQIVVNEKIMKDLGYRNNVNKQFTAESRGGGAPPDKTLSSGEQDDIIKEVTKKVRSPLYQAKKGWAQMFNKAWVDEDQVVIDELRWIEKNTGQEGLVNKFIINSNNQRGSNAWANVYIKHNQNLNDAFGGMSKQEANAFSDYVNARTELSTAKGRLTSRPVSELRQIVADGEEQFGSRFKSLNSYYKELADYAHKSGLITDEMHAKYKGNDNYARIQRDMSDLADPYQGTSGRRRGMSKSKMEQKRSGSQREILPAGDSAVTWAQTIFKEAARNKTGTHLVDILMKSGLANKLVDSTNVIARRKIFKTLSELKPVRDDLEKLIKQTVKELKKTNKVNFKRGQKILGTIKNKSGDYRNKAMKVANGGANLPGNSKKPAKLPTEADLEEAFYQFLDGNPGLLNDIEKFFTTKAQIKQLRQRLERAKDQFNQVKALRKDLYEDTLHMKDGSTKNKNIVSIKRNGIREVYEVSKEMKEAMDNINPFVINSFMRFIGAPARVFRAGTTGLEPTFIVRNYLKDQVGSAINSQSLIRTHNPARMSDGLLNATMDALGLNDNPLWLEFQKFYGDMTSFDLTRNAKNTKEMVERIRGGKTAGVKQSIMHPIRTLEDYASITEKATRFQNFVGEYNRQIKAGMSHEDAVEQAALAAWQNSVDFSRAGTWGRIMNLLIPYWNPSIQGVRQMARVLKDRPIRSVFTASTLIGTPLILATAWNYSNQDSAEVYENIRETEKENNLVIVLPGTKVTDQDSKGNYPGVIKVPMAPGWKDVFMPTRRAMEAYYTKDPTKMAKIASDIIQAASGPISTQSPEAFLGSFAPQAVKPWAQQAANKDFFSGNEIVPEWINEDTDADGNPIPESQKAYDGTSGTARAIGNLTNTSPIRVEKFIKDTTGKFGTEILHGVDTLAANAGLIPEDQIGGTSIAGSFKQSFNEARGIKNYNASEGSKYYENVKEVTSNMTGNELSAFNTLHPSKTNFLGDTIYETNSIYNASARQDVYNRFPKVFEADKKIDAKNRSEGKVGNPLFDLTEEQRKKVLFKEALPPGAKDPELSNLYSQEWYVDYSNAKQAYFDGIQKDQQKELQKAKESGDVEKVSKITESIAKFNTSDNPYPEASAELQSVMDYYNSLAKGTGERSAWIRSHPNEWAAMQNQYAAIDNWQNKQRAKYGLDATEGAEGQANGYTSYTQSSGYGSSGSPSHAKTPESYRVSINAGGQFKKPKVSSVPKVASLKVTHKYAEKPTVKLRKSKV